MSTLLLINFVRYIQYDSSKLFHWSKISSFKLLILLYALTPKYLFMFPHIFSGIQVFIKRNALLFLFSISMRHLICVYYHHLIAISIFRRISLILFIMFLIYLHISDYRCFLKNSKLIVPILQYAPHTFLEYFSITSKIFSHFEIHILTPGLWR